ncbi:MAG TPA: ABC transporter substrate-binding protein, partial [Candidatus Limnocylindria bacterium]|nr:ABC transporter substrate-binding protein [Candidatus Limnocylindria bacterium]
MRKRRIQKVFSGNLKSKSGPADKNLKWLGSVTLFIALVIFGGALEAQQPTKIPRIIYLSGSPLSANAARYEAFRQGLRELGYMEGKNIVIEYRYAEGKPDSLSDLAAELARLKVDIIVSAGAQATGAAKEATNTIPIVMTNEGDPVGTGFVASLAQPGGNITGLSTLAPEISGKRLELLKEIVANLSRVAVFGTSIHPGNAQSLKETELAGAALNVQLQFLDVREPHDIETAFRAASKGRAGAVLVLAGAVLNSQRKQMAELAVKHRLPAIYPWPESVQDGGLISYGVNRNDLDRRAATYVDKILKGRKPADLPVEQPIKFEFITNLKAAKQIGLTI